jgi:hypothetical protein
VVFREYHGHVCTQRGGVDRRAAASQICAAGAGTIEHHPLRRDHRSADGGGVRGGGRTHQSARVLEFLLRWVSDGLPHRGTTIVQSDGYPIALRYEWRVRTEANFA